MHDQLAKSIDKLLLLKYVNDNQIKARSNMT